MRSWSKEDTSLLVKLSPSMTAKDLAIFFNRSKGCIVVKCRKLKIPYKKENSSTLEEVEFVKNNYKIMSYKEIAKALNKTAFGIKGIIAKHKLANKINKLKIGDRIGKLIVICEEKRTNRRRKIKVLCDCGKSRIVDASYCNANMKSCGCDLPGNNEKEKGLTSWINLYNQYKKSAKERGKLFELTLDQFQDISSKNCYYCNLEPRDYSPYVSNKQIKTGTDRAVIRSYIKANGIDRTNNNIGYVFDNCVPCCEKCNRFKHAYTQEDFLNHVKRIFNYQHGGNNA